MLSLLFAVLAVILFVITALGVADVLAWGLASLAAAHIPWGSLNLPSRA